MQAKAAAHLVGAIRDQGYEIVFEDPAADATEAMGRILWDKWSEDEIGEHQFIGRLFDDRGQIYRRIPAGGSVDLAVPVAAGLCQTAGQGCCGSPSGHVCSNMWCR
jgi:hypothetical protein